MTGPIAVIGAGSYVGARLIEQSVLSGNPSVVAITRAIRSQGRLARFGFRTVQGNASDTASLVPLLRGCRMAVNLTQGDSNRIVGDVQAIYRACREAEVPLFVHMSTAEVFGRSERRDIAEDELPSGRHWMEYARAKAKAEHWLASQPDDVVKSVILRPGLIWGPGSGWLVGPAQDLIDGRAYLINDGRGVCNLIHVDNLIRHFVQLADDDDVQSGIFNVSDSETHSWADYYGAIAAQVGVDPSSIHLLTDRAFHEDVMQRILRLTDIAPAKALKRRLAGGTKVRIKQQLQDRLRPPLRQAQLDQPAPSVTKNLWWLQGTVHALPTEAFRRRYPQLQLEPFPVLMGAAGRWLRHAGFFAPTCDSDVRLAHSTFE